MTVARCHQDILMKLKCTLAIALLVMTTLGCASKSLDGGSNEGGAKADGAAPDGGSAGTRAASEGCDADHGCVEGLSCLDFSVSPPGGACKVVGKQCTKPCAAGDNPGASCASLGPKYLCFKGCAEDFACGATP